uniref:beta strand repeat-containing protein n=1 Tax=Helicobacter pullorum TaxID=35818 RepID=UPI0024307DF3
MDSKSKLESKNPNKIQTAKIQDSKIQLESNPKDLAKLESNSPKLKDSKVSKTSKDSMKLESSPKLDSKTSQKSNSKSKSPKIQRAKNTCDSKQSTNSKNSSKLKSFIRTIPISIALASALTSNAVAEWTHGNRTNRYEIVNGIINQNLTLITTHGYITFQGSTDTTNLTINANVTGEGVSGGGPQNGLIALSGNNIVGGTITNNANFSVGGSSKRGLAVNEYAILKSFVNNSSFKHTGSNSLIYVRAGGTIQNITNNGEMSVANVTNPNDGWKSVIRLEDYRNLTGSRVDAINFIGNSTTSNVNNAGTRWNVISIGSATSSIGTITARDNATIDGHFSFDQGTIRNITFQDSANMTGNISLANSAKITNGITIGGNSTGGSGNNASLTGDISLTNNSRIQGGIVLDNSANMTGNISLSTARNSDNITIDSINIGNGSTMTGNISLSTANGGGNITIDSINIGNGSTMTGDISVLGNSKITDSITIAGILDGNVSAIWNTGGNGTINQMDISGEITKKVQLDNETKIATLNLNGGTITGGINFQEFTTNSNNDIATIVNLTLNSDAYIGGIDIGNTSGGNAKGVISNLTLNGTSSIGSIVNNRGTISELTLNNDSTITNGITNAVEGNIGTITSNTNNINNTITNSGTINELVVSKGTITYIDSNNSGVVDSLLQVEDGATLKMGSSGNGTITIGSDLGSVLDLKQGSTFEGNLKNASVIKEWKNVSNIDGSFINDTGASVVDLTAGQISQNLLNEGNITNLTIDKTIGGALINDNGGVINTLIIQDSSVITSGITNNASSTITTLTINDGANVTGGIRNNSNIGSLNLQENVTYDGSGSITNALDIAGTKTLTATNNGINILFANNATGTINNEGIISGNLNNQNGSTIKTFNTGSISGSIANNAGATIETLNVDSNVGSIANNTNATIETLNVTGNVTNGITNTGDITTLIASGNVTNGITNDSNIDTLTINANANLGSGIKNNSNIANLNVKSNVTYAGNGSITNALDINGSQTQFTINNGAGNTLTLTNTAGANSVKTITNKGTIIGNLINTLTTNWTFGVLQGNFTNNGELIALTDTGSITGILTNGNNGIINTLNTSK